MVTVVTPCHAAAAPLSAIDAESNITDAIP
jgi:hypothetical protein